MKRNIMGELRPATAEEIQMAFGETVEDLFDVEAEISHDPYDPNGGGESGINMTGYTAEIRDLNTGNSIFTTQGFEDKAELVKILKACGLETDQILDAE